MANDAFSLWAARLCLGIVGLLCVSGAHYGNVRFAPIAAGFAILAGVCYADRRAFRGRAAQRLIARPSLSSGDAPRLSPRSTHTLGS